MTVCAVCHRDPGVMNAQDDVLIAVADRTPVPAAAITALPPWRAYLLLGIAADLRLPMDDGTTAREARDGARAAGSGR